MSRRDLRASWARTRTNLEAARCALTDPDDPALGLYEEWLSHNELGLAADALADCAALQRAPRPVWVALAEALDEMKIGPDDGEYAATRRQVQDHLEAAHEWAELRDLINQWDPIGVYGPSSDCPPDEYDCLYHPLMTRLQAGEATDAIGGYLEEELSNHFGLDPKPANCHTFAQRLVGWYADRRFT